MVVRDLTGHGEFSGTAGLINDEERRAARVIGQEAGPLVQGPNEELMEIYATNPAFLEAEAGTDLAANGDPATSDLTFRNTGR